MRNLIISFLLLETVACGSAQSEPFVQRLYSEFGWAVSRVRQPPVFQSETVTGTFWVVAVNGEKHLVTAGHNLGLADGRLTVVPRDSTNAFHVCAETLLGRYAYGISSVGFPQQRKADWLALKPEHESVLGRSRAFTLAEKPPQIGDRVQVWGFAGHTHPKNLSLTVVDFSEGKDFLVLNERLPHGYSGGVVLNDQGEAVAVVVATKEEHASALILTPSGFHTITWKPIREVHASSKNDLKKFAADRFREEREQIRQLMLPKYDLNRNGFFDSEERARFTSDERQLLRDYGL